MKLFSRQKLESGLVKVGYVAIDTGVMAFAYLMAHVLRFNFWEPRWGWRTAAISFITVWIVQLIALSLFGCYRMLWRFTSATDIPRFACAAFSATVVLVAIRWQFPNLWWMRPPYGVAILNGFFAFAGLLSIRLLCRLGFEGRFWHPSPESVARVLLIGAGDAGNRVARELQRAGAKRPFVVGFLDDDPTKQGSTVQGIRVLGRIDELPGIVSQRAVSQVIVTIPSGSHEVLRRVVKLCERAGVSVRILPEYRDVISGKVSVSKIRNVDVADLLGRAETQVDSHAVVALLGRKRVMVTGAGGSIGGELCRQIVRCGPQELLMVDRSEFALYTIDRKLRKIGVSVPVVPLIADIGDEERMEAIFTRYRPQMVIHAAAHKHVPMMELNPGEAIKNNTLATRRLGELAIRAGVERFVFISTDKAVAPVSVMGMSKRLAEIAVQDLNHLEQTRFSAVRFGNVLDSSGSVVPLFREQIANGGPVTVTHPDMKRYFMTIHEAVSLVLQAAALAKGGEIFVLDMGEPVRILELAEEMITLSGLRPYEDIPINLIGIRPGEKMFEALDVSEQSAYKTGHARIFVSKIGAIGQEKVAEMLKTCADFVKSDSVNPEALHALVERLDGKKTGDGNDA